MTINFLLILFLLLTLNYSLFLIKLLWGLKRLKRKGVKPVPRKYSVSVIIPFRNEEDNIMGSLKCLEEQALSFEEFEVVYVDDLSTDDSYRLLNDNIKSKNIRVVKVPEDYSRNQHKKRAIRFGIENSSGEIIVTTDADCIQDPDWLITILSEMSDEIGFVSGPVEFISSDEIFSRLQRIEFAGLVLAGAGLIGSGNPLICNAANIAYRRNVFHEAGGFEYKHSLSSGDDELLMQKISKETNYGIRFCYDKKAIVKTYPNRNVSEFYHQRKRWASKGLFYSDKLLILKLILIFLFYLSLPVQLILILYSIHFFSTLLISFSIKGILEYLVLREGTRKLFKKDIFNLFFLAELVHIPYIIIAGISGIFGNYNWKGRKVKR